MENTPIQTRNLNALPELEKLKHLNPLEDMDSRSKFLSNFDWTISALDRDTKKQLKPYSLTFTTFLRDINLTLNLI